VSLPVVQYGELQRVTQQPEFNGPDQTAGLSGGHRESLATNPDGRDPDRFVLVEKRQGLGVDLL
jgi:hypothetical protein